MSQSYLDQMFGLSVKTAVVTGGHRGLGASIARGLAAAGANVAIADICSEQDGAAIVQEIEALGSRALFIRTDVTDKQSVEQAVERVLQEFGSIEILVNNAGVADTSKSEELPDEEWNKVMDVNLKGTLYFCQTVGKHMIEQQYGRIVNISSYWGLTGNPAGLSYSVSKGGVISLTKVLAVEWGEHNITVNAIAPGYIHTDMTEWVWGNPKINDYITDRIPLQHRLGTPEEVGGLVTFLSSQASSYVTGTLIPIDGGLLIQAGKREWFVD